MTSPASRPPREPIVEPTPVTQPIDAAPIDEVARRRRMRRFLVGLLVLVALLVLFAVGYVRLYDRLLVDPSQPRNVKAPLNLRVLMFELLLLVTVGAVLTAWIVRKLRPKP